MDLIREMASVIDKDKPKSFDLLIPKGSKLRRLYGLALSDNFVDDNTAARQIYESDASDKRYMMLKSNLINKLSELILIGDHSDINKKNFIAVKFDCDRQMTIAQKLLYINVYHNAERITKRVLKKAQNFSLVEVELTCCETLRKINYLKGFSDKVEKYHILVNEKMMELQAVEHSKGMIQIILSEIKFIRSQTKQLALKCEQYLNDLEQFEAASPFFKFNFLRLQLIKAHLENDFREWQTILVSIEDLFRKYDFLETEHTILEINVLQLKYLIASRDYSSTKPVLKKLLANTSFEAFNRFEVLAEECQLLVHQGKFQKAVSVLNEVLNQPRFKKLDKMDQGAWMLRKAYLGLVTELKGSSLASQLQIGNLQYFYQKCAPMSKDKLGYNLQFVIVRTLMLQYRNALDFDNEANNLKVYYQRYMKDQSLPRTRIFYKSFVKIVKACFEEGIYQTELEQIKQDLQKHPYLEYNEFIAYDVLLEMCEPLARRI